MTVVMVGNADQFQQVSQQLERFAAMLEDAETNATVDDLPEGSLTIEDATVEAMTEAPIINTANEYYVGFHMGHVRPGHYPVHDTKQSAYRYSAWLLKAAEVLPDEEGQEDYGFDDIRAAISASAETADGTTENPQ